MIQYMTEGKRIHWPIAPAHGGWQTLVIERDDRDVGPDFVRLTLPECAQQSGWLVLPREALIEALMLMGEESE